MGQIKAVLFDLGQVIAFYDNIKACIALSEHGKASPDELRIRLFWSGIARKCESGEMTNEELYREILKALGARADTLSQEIAIALWGDIFTQNPIIEDVLCRISVPLFLLSNLSEGHWLSAKKLPAIRRFFAEEAQQILSFRVRACKPDRRIYQEAITRAGADPQHLLYIDDIEENVDVADLLGINTIQYDADRYPPAYIVSKLEQYHVLS